MGRLLDGSSQTHIFLSTELNATQAQSSSPRNETVSHSESRSHGHPITRWSVEKSRFPRRFSKWKLIIMPTPMGKCFPPLTQLQCWSGAIFLQQFVRALSRASFFFKASSATSFSIPRDASVTLPPLSLLQLGRPSSQTRPDLTLMILLRSYSRNRTPYPSSKRHRRASDTRPVIPRSLPLHLLGWLIDKSEILNCIGAHRNAKVTARSALGDLTYPFFHRQPIFEIISTEARSAARRAVRAI